MGRPVSEKRNSGPPMRREAVAPVQATSVANVWNGAAAPPSVGARRCPEDLPSLKVRSRARGTTLPQRPRQRVDGMSAWRRRSTKCYPENLGSIAVSIFSIRPTIPRTRCARSGLQQPRSAPSGAAALPPE